VLKDLTLGSTVKDSVFNENFADTPMADFFEQTEDGLYMLK
jgi:hypothetical protein